MSSCVICLVNDTQSLCLIVDTCLEVQSDIESYIHREIFDDDVVCQSCLMRSVENSSNLLESILNAENNTSNTLFIEEEYLLNVENTSNSDENIVLQEHTLEFYDNSCILCYASLAPRRSHNIPVCPQRDEILRRISPRNIFEGSRVCYRCWVSCSRALGISVSTGVENDCCLLCQSSLCTRRSHLLYEGQERDYIQESITPQQIQSGDRVCHPCWLSCQRNIQQESTSSTPQQRQAPDCLVCFMSLRRRNTHLVNDSIREVISRRINPRQIPDQAYICDTCWTWAQNSEELLQSRESPEPIPMPLPVQQSVNLPNFKKIGNSNSRCFVTGCTNRERLAVPKYLKKRLLVRYYILIAENARVCYEHKVTYHWDNILISQELSNIFTQIEIETMIKLGGEGEKNQINFSNLEANDEDTFKYWTGLRINEYMTIYNQIPSLVINSKSPKKALGLFLIKLRTGETHQRLSSLFSFSKGYISTLIKKARNALLLEYVPRHLGLGHISREQIMNKNLIIPEGLFGNREVRKPIIIADGTYIYVQKSSNYLYQKQTYSLHKYSNLVKPFLMVATDGHIIDICGPYAATKTDAEIMISLFQDENSPYRQYFRPGDVFILDRGFRDALPLLEQCGYQIYKPESIEEGQTQMSTLRANKSRLVTLCRWVVEVVNGRFKLQYKLFRQKFFNVASKHLMDDFKIGGAILNEFHTSLVDRTDAEAILERAQLRVNLPNDLGNYIVGNNINRQRTIFERIDGNHPQLDIFPQMSMSDLIMFALGIYQIKQARSYFGEHIRQNGTFVVEISYETFVPSELSLHGILLRGRIRSRHRSSKIYYTYVLINTNSTVNNWEDMIKNYYCSCVCGMRTVGCCAHVMTVVWYLGWARHQENIQPPALFLDDVLVREDF